MLGCSSRQQLGSLGECRLQNGAVLRDCRIGYRTFGRLDAARSNAVLVVSWSTGTSADLSRQLGRERLVDTSRDFVIAVDALGNGVSSSPSNSTLQPGDAFPSFTVSDMVETQRRLLREVLGIERIKAVVGISFGGMQVFEWAVAHPSSMEAAVAIVGTPKTTDAERRRWRSWSQEMLAISAPWRAASALFRLEPRSAFHELAIDARDYARQAEAIAAHDVSARFAGSMESAARAVRARMLVVLSPTDEVVDPAPALAFARLCGAQVVMLNGHCGHRDTSCDKETLFTTVRRFLAN